MECSFLFGEREKQPLYYTYTKINNNHMKINHLVIFFPTSKDTAIYPVN